jgi:hypothetical protein
MVTTGDATSFPLPGGERDRVRGLDPGSSVTV